MSEKIKELAEQFADSKERRGCAYWKGLFDGFAEGISKSAVWQLCPKCTGQGIVSKPPHIAGDVSEWSSTSTAFTCNVCNGNKIISMINQTT